MGAEELNEPLAAADVEQGRARAVSDITIPGQVDPDKVKNAVFWTVLGFMFSNAVGLSFSFIHPRKHDAMMEFYAGYILELSLSLDNLFAFYLVFKYFKVVSERAQNRVLFWGIVGAIVLRAFMVAVGAAAIHQYRPLLLVCAAVLIYSTYQVFFMEEDDDDEDLENNSVVKLAQWLVPVSGTYHSSDFFHEGKATPLLLVLVVIEFSDVVFAVDSVPAIFGITEDPYIVWAACMCAIMCLRSLYTLIVQFVADLEYMNKAIGLVLFFIAIKLILDLCFEIHVSIALSLSFVAGILTAGTILSILHKQSEEAEEEE
jgi:TerC family integral membrane protein